MHQELLDFAARLRFATARQARDDEFNDLALELFALQLKHNPAYRKICEGRKLMPRAIEHWTEIPVVPTAVFKELDLTCIPPDERTAVFHSSGTTEQKPSRHYHCPVSLELYETSLWSWFVENVVPDLRFTIYDLRLICLTPPPAQAPHSSLVHMFETIRSRACQSAESAFSQTRLRWDAGNTSSEAFFGRVAADGSWTLDFNTLLAALNSTLDARRSTVLLGTAFSFVHLLDYLADNNLSLQLPSGSRVMETGGYKGRSRTMPKGELYARITERLGIPPKNIICEYGMSELSSQAYDSAIHPPSSILHPPVFRLPPWAQVQIISPETGREVADGETGLIRVFDLANAFSVMAVQTEDLGIRRGDGFDLIGRAAMAEARGCSLMAV